MSVIPASYILLWLRGNFYENQTLPEKKGDLESHYCGYNKSQLFKNLKSSGRKANLGRDIGLLQKEPRIRTFEKKYYYIAKLPQASPPCEDIRLSPGPIPGIPKVTEGGGLARIRNQI